MLLQLAEIVECFTDPLHHLDRRHGCVAQAGLQRRFLEILLLRRRVRKTVGLTERPKHLLILVGERQKDFAQLREARFDVPEAWLKLRVFFLPDRECTDHHAEAHTIGTGQRTRASTARYGFPRT